MKAFVVCVGVIGVIASIMGIGVAIFSGLVWAGVGNVMLILYCLYVLIGSIAFWQNERR